MVECGIDNAANARTLRPIEDSEEAERVARAVLGDTEAIDWLLHRYRSRVVRLAAHILRGSADAEDVAQEAFVRVPMRAGIARALRGVGWPIACVLVIAYGVSTVVTLRGESAAQAELDGTITHEGRYYAARVGETWPGPAQSIAPISTSRRD